MFTESLVLFAADALSSTLLAKELGVDASQILNLTITQLSSSFSRVSLPHLCFHRRFTVTVRERVTAGECVVQHRAGRIVVDRVYSANAVDDKQCIDCFRAIGFQATWYVFSALTRY